MSQWAEIRHMFLVDGVPKKEISRRFDLDIKTVRRAIEQAEAPQRQPSPRPRLLDPWREDIRSWLLDDPKISAKRIGRLLAPKAGPLSQRTVRKYVARLRREISPREAFVHRTHAPGDTVEFDFGESWAVVADRLHKVKFCVAVLPASNACFAKAYPVERLECLLDGMACAFRYFGGVPRRAVLDNTSLAVKRVFSGPDREETQAFHAFRGGYPLHADFCAPAKGWEKGSVEGAVRYVRANAFRPRPEVESWEALNAHILQTLEEDLDARRHPDGRSVRQAWIAEREHLRPLPAHPPETCRVLSRVADKFGHVRVQRAHYSVPIEHAYRPVTVKLFHDQVRIAVADQVVAVHPRSFEEGTKVLDPLHVLSLLARKHRAIPEATALQDWQLPAVFSELREALRAETRKPDREWVRVLLLAKEFPLAAVAAAAEEALQRGSPRRETVEQLLRQRQGGAPWRAAPVPLHRPELALEVAPADLSSYDALGGTSR